MKVLPNTYTSALTKAVQEEANRRKAKYEELKTLADIVAKAINETSN